MGVVPGAPDPEPDRGATTARGRSTQARLLDAAETMFLERGVDNVSLSQIRIAAGQRNPSAIQFHFGDRMGLLRAVSERHMPQSGRRAPSDAFATSPIRRRDRGCWWPPS